jgi:mono/diheme cytochrome c family protein
MRRLLRWFGILLGGLVTLAVVASVVVYVLSERELRHIYPVPVVSLTVPTDAASVAEGQRLATLHGCVGSCHGRQAEGTVLFDQPIIGRIVAPNLTSAVRRYDDAQLAVLIRNGVRPDGSSPLVMPSEAFVGLSDEEVGRIIAFLRSLPAFPGPERSLTLGPLGRLGVASGQFKTAARQIAETIPPPEAADEVAALGRHLARTVCAQCHGTQLRGASTPGFTSPDLRLVGGYTDEQFARLMRTGVALGGRELTTMSPAARTNLSQMTDAEIAALYRYLRALPEAAPR